MNRRSLPIKRLLKESLLRLLETNTTEEINVKKLCEDAGTTVPPFYAHFESVRNVMKEIEKEITEKVREICRTGRTDTRGKPEKRCEYLYRMKDTELLLFKKQYRQ